MENMVQFKKRIQLSGERMIWRIKFSLAMFRDDLEIWVFISIGERIW